MAAEATTLAAAVMVARGSRAHLRDVPSEEDVMQLEGEKVLVVGGATGGAATALLLARSGATVTLVEKVAELRAVGAGLAIAENGAAVLRGLGIDVDAIGAPVHDGRIEDGAGRTLMRVSGPRVVMTRRSTLQARLLDAIAREPRIELRLGTELVRCDANGEVELRQGETHTTARYGLVVGADGVRSRVREQGDFGARVRPTGVSYLRALVPDASLAQSAEAWTSAGIFGSFALPDGTYAFASVGTAASRAALEARDLEALRRVWRRAYAPGAAILDAVPSFDELLVNAVVRVDCQRFVDGRLVLVGDAAHAMPPNLGQGANSALVDAAILRAEIARAGTLDEALAAYDARRRPAVRAVVDTAQRIGSLSEWTSAPARWLRDRILVPLVARRTDDALVRRVLQEPPEVLASACA